MSVYMLPVADYIILNSKNKNTAFIYNSTYYITLRLPSSWTHLNKEHSVIGIKNEYVQKNYKLISNDIINSYIYKWDFFLFNKLSYKGKSFKLKKKKNFVNFTLNTSHPTLSYSNLHIIKKLKKTKLLYFFINERLFKDFIYNIIFYRLINIFTKRGLRLSRMKILKKKGKTNMKI